MALKHPRAPATDAFRALRAVIQTKTDQEAAKILLVSGAKPGEGKSTIAANLAVVLAQAGTDVLLVDADLHRGTQHRFFSIPRNAGLSSVLLDYKPNGTDDNLKSLLESVVRSTAQNHLDILVSGLNATEGSQLLGLETMGQILAAASENYNYIIIDSPPLLAASDAMIMSADATDVLLVVKAGTTRRKELRQALAQLQEVGANVIGIVLNRVNVTDKGYYYPYYNYYGKQDDSLAEEDLSIPVVSGGSGTGRLPSNGLVNINQATLQELESLPGIGPGLAQAIVDHRELIGFFNRIEDIKDFPGIGPAKFEALKDLITVN